MGPFSICCLIAQKREKSGSPAHSCKEDWRGGEEEWIHFCTIMSAEFTQVRQWGYLWNIAFGKAFYRLFTGCWYPSFIPPNKKCDYLHVYTHIDENLSSVWVKRDKNNNKTKKHAFPPNIADHEHKSESKNPVTNTLIMFNENKTVRYLQKFVEEECEPVCQHFLSHRLCPANTHKAHNEHVIPVLMLPT